MRFGWKKRHLMTSLRPLGNFSPFSNVLQTKQKDLLRKESAKTTQNKTTNSVSLICKYKNSEFEFLLWNYIVSLWITVKWIILKQLLVENTVYCKKKKRHLMTQDLLVIVIVYHYFLMFYKQNKTKMCQSNNKYNKITISVTLICTFFF